MFFLSRRTDDLVSPAASKGRLEAEVNVFLGVQADQVGGNVHHLRMRTSVILLFMVRVSEPSTFGSEPPAENFFPPKPCYGQDDEYLKKILNRY